MDNKPLYQGSVKNLWALDAEHLEFEFTDAYSVFDWGRMPDELPAKGESLAGLGAFFFQLISAPKAWEKIRGSDWFAPMGEGLRSIVEQEIDQLCAEGLPHHFVRRSAKNKLVVKRVEIERPTTHVVGSQTLHQYPRGQHADKRLLPLEVVFRFGMPAGSSLIERLTPTYSRQLGFDEMPEAGSPFIIPILEFFTKLEDTDRFLTWEQALHYADLSIEVFQKLLARSLCLAVLLRQTFERHKLELWDGKFEWALENGRLMLVDSIGPDELRLVDPKTGTQISKEFLRVFYRKTPWFKEIVRAKTEAAADPNVDWKKLILNNFGPPPALTPDFRAAAEALYPSLAFSVTGENPQGVGISLPESLERIRRCLAS